MKQLAVVCIAIGIAATTIPFLWAKSAEPEEKLILSIRLLDKPKADGKERVLAHSKVATLIGREFSPFQGEKRKSQSGGADLVSGTGVSGKLTRRTDGRVHLALTFSQRTYVPSKGNADTDVIRIDGLDIQCFLQLGIVKRIDCSNSQTCELQLEKLE